MSTKPEQAHYRTVTDRRGESREVGEWALHVQCPWRFVRTGSIILARTDLNYYPEGDDYYDWDRGGESLFDRRATHLNSVLEAAEIKVSSIPWTATLQAPTWRQSSFVRWVSRTALKQAAPKALSAATQNTPLRSRRGPLRAPPYS